MDRAPNDLLARIKSNISPGVLHQLETPPAELPTGGFDSRTVTSKLTSRARLAVQKETSDGDEDADYGTARYCLIEQEDGDWPKLKTFDAIEDLIARLAFLNGSDTVVRVIFGVPLEVTSGNPRMLVMPNSVGVPFDNAEKRVELAGGGFQVQEDGFLGLPEFSADVGGRTIEEAEAVAAFDDEDTDAGDDGVDG